MTDSAGNRAPPVRLLYVEDNPLVRELTCELLSREDRIIFACASAEDALREFKQQTYDLVITDLSLPAMSGMDLAREVTRIRPDVFVIIASGYPLSAQMYAANSRWRAVIKPVQADDMDALIDECMGSLRTQAARNIERPADN
jgi:DNA-binding NtrC family response regulator